MGGVHTAYRKSSSANYVAVESTIVLPQTSYCRENNADATNGAFPEFFHGFYKGSIYGLDIGIGYKNGSYRLFFYSYANTQSTQWFESNAFALTSDRTYTLKTYFSGGYLITRCMNSSGTVVASLDVYLQPEAYTSMSQGCTINRELCIAINPSVKGGSSYTVPARAYFSQTKFTKTKMTTNTGSTVYMTTSNTTTQHGKIDNGTPTTTYESATRLNIMENGTYVADVATATFDKANIKVSPIV